MSSSTSCIWFNYHNFVYANKSSVAYYLNFIWRTILLGNVSCFVVKELRFTNFCYCVGIIFKTKVNWKLYEFIKTHCLSSTHLSSLKCLGVVTRMRSSFTIGRNTSNTNRRTYSDFQTPRQELKIQGEAEFFLTNFEVLWNRRRSFLRVFELTPENQGESWANLCNLFLRFPNVLHGIDFLCTCFMKCYWVWEKCFYYQQTTHSHRWSLEWNVALQ